MTFLTYSSGAETIAHLRENGRITILFCAFEGPPRIVRLFGIGTYVESYLYFEHALNVELQVPFMNLTRQDTMLLFPWTNVSLVLGLLLSLTSTKSAACVSLLRAE